VIEDKIKAEVDFTKKKATENNLSKIGITISTKGSKNSDKLEHSTNATMCGFKKPNRTSTSFKEVSTGKEPKMH
jgi:hypothetical protein